MFWGLVWWGLLLTLEGRSKLRSKLDLMMKIVDCSRLLWKSVMMMLFLKDFLASRILHIYTTSLSYTFSLATPGLPKCGPQIEGVIMSA